MEVSRKTLLLIGAAAMTWSAAIWISLDPGPYQPRQVVMDFPAHWPDEQACRAPQPQRDPKAEADCRRSIIEWDVTRAELIQQVRAANAAEAANQLTLAQGRLTLLQTLVGLFTLLAAAAAALFAGRAAWEARRGSDAAERNVETFERASKLQLIPYVGLKEYSLACEFTNDIAEYTTELCLSNFGQTPAMSTVIRHTQLISDENADFTELEGKPFGEIGVISRGQPIVYKTTNRMTEEERSDLAKSEFRLMFVAEVVYLDVYGDPQTYRFVLASDDGERWNSLSAEAYTGFSDDEAT